MMPNLIRLSLNSLPLIHSLTVYIGSAFKSGIERGCKINEVKVDRAKVQALKCIEYKSNINASIYNLECPIQIRFMGEVFGGLTGPTEEMCLQYN